MVKILLISAPYKESLYSGDKDNYLSRDYSLITLGSALVESGNEVKIIPNIYSFDEIKPVLKRNLDWADMLAVSSMTHTYNNALKLINYSKELNPNIFVVIGGHHVTWLPQQALNDCHNIDVVVKGEGEKALVNLADNILDPNKLSNIKGIYFKKGEKIVFTGEQSFLDPLYGVDSNLLSKYIKEIFQRFNKLDYVTALSRGCPFSCNFCVESCMVGRKYRSKPIDLFLNELGVLSKYSKKIDRFFFCDSNFNAPIQDLKKIGNYNKANNINFNFNAYLRTNNFSKEYAKSLKSDAGFDFISFGVDNIHPQVQKLMNKSVSFESIIKAGKICKEYGLRNATNWIIGLPGDNVQRSAYCYVRAKYLLRKNLFDSIEANIFTPYPGTHFFNYAKKYGIHFLSKNWDDFERNHRPVIRYDNFNELEIWASFLQFHSLSYGPEVMEQYLK